MPSIKVAMLAVSAVGWAVLIVRGVDRVRADAIYAAAYRDGFSAGSA